MECYASLEENDDAKEDKADFPANQTMRETEIDGIDITAWKYEEREGHATPLIDRLLVVWIDLLAH